AATFPGRNGAIAYVQDRHGENSSQPRVDAHALMVQPPGGAAARALFECVLTDGVQSGGDCSVVHVESPAYSPDGRLIAFDAGRRIALISTSGGPATLLPPVSEDDGHPAFLPGGRWIAFTATNDRGGTDI